jgi:hypothetical protein
MSDELKTILDESLEKKKGITFQVNGTTIIGYVTKINNGTIEIASRQYSKGLVFTDKITAVELS